MLDTATDLNYIDTMKTKNKHTPSLVQMKTFRVAAVSENTNSFGLTGVVLVARDGEAYEAATYTLGAGFELATGTDITLPICNAYATGLDRYSWHSTNGRGFEIPRALPLCPVPVLNELYPA